MRAFDKIAGYPREKEELQKLAEIFSNREKYERKGAVLPKGIIFYGPAGTGKTLFAEVLAEECSLEKINISISDSASEGDICKQIRKAFLQGSKRKAPVMIFFDELDKVLPNEREQYYSDRSKTVLAQLLTLIDGMEKVNNIVFVATCNDYYALPESITRAGRFDKKICLGLPDNATRTAVLEMYMQSSPAKFEMSPESIAKLTSGFCPAALKTLVNDCILMSDENNYITEDLIRRKINEISEEDLPAERSEQSYTVDAVRNLGGFLIARAYCNSDYVLTVEEDSVCNGFLESIIDDEEYDYDDDDYDYDDDDYEDDDDDEDEDEQSSFSIYSKADFLAAVTALLGGFAAQELLLGKTYSNLHGRVTDINNLLFRMSACGMLGFDVCYDSCRVLPYSEKFRERTETVFTKIIEECFEKAKEHLQRNITLLQKLVPVLASRKSIDKCECEALIEEFGGITPL